VDNSTTNTRPGDSFVDDTITGVTSDDTSREPVPLEEMDLTTDEVELIVQMQVEIQFFLDLRWVTGGDLAPEKYVWYLITHRWKKVCLDYWQNERAIEGYKSHPTQQGKHQRPRERQRIRDILL
jgi:hypothetical protein